MDNAPKAYRNAKTLGSTRLVVCTGDNGPGDWVGLRQRMLRRMLRRERREVVVFGLWIFGKCMLMDDS